MPKLPDAVRSGELKCFMTIGDPTESVKSDVNRIKNHPLVPDDIPVHGYMYDCKTGRLVEVPT